MTTQDQLIDILKDDIKTNPINHGYIGDHYKFLEARRELTRDEANLAKVEAGCRRTINRLVNRYELGFTADDRKAQTAKREAAASKRLDAKLTKEYAKIAIVIHYLKSSGWTKDEVKEAQQAILRNRNHNGLCWKAINGGEYSDDSTLEDVVRVAMGAHYRHTQTNYDSDLAAGVPYDEARASNTC